MSRLSIFILFVILLVCDSKGEISDKRLCGDPSCSDPVSYAKTLIRYASNDARILSFQGNVKVTVFSKSAGSRPDLWGVEINGKRGYAPRDFIREYQVVKGKLDHIVPTSDDIASTSAEQGSQVDASSDNKQELPPLSGDNKLNLPPFPNIGAAAEEINNDILSSSETFEPYEVADGTTIYLSTDEPTDPVIIQATTTDSSIHATVQTQLGSDAENGNIDKPNPSIVLPQPSTSSDVTMEKEESEGSAEKIYQYLVSNFMSEQGSGEPTLGDKALVQNENEESKGEEIESVPDPSKSDQRVLIESTESDSIPVNIDASIKPEGSIIESDGTAKHQVSPDTLEKPALNESEEDDDDEEEGEDEDEEDEEEYVDSVEDIEIDPTDSGKSGPSTDDKHESSMPTRPIEKDKDNSILADKKTEYPEPNLQKEPNSIEIKTKLEILNHTDPDDALNIVHDNDFHTLDNGSINSDSDVSLEQISDHLNHSFNTTPADLVRNELTDNSTSGVSANESVLQLQDSDNGSNNKAKERTTDGMNPDSTQSLLSETQSHESLLVKSNDLEKSVDETFSELSMTQEPEVRTLDISPEIVEEKNTSSEEEILDAPVLPIGSDNMDGGVGTDQNSLNNTDTSPNADATSVEPGPEQPLHDVPQSNITESDISDSSNSFKSEDQSVLTTISSTETGYTDISNEDSPLNVVTDMPTIETDDDTEAITEDSSLKDVTDIPATQTDDIMDAVTEDSETSGGFFSNLFGSLFGSFRSAGTMDDAKTETPMEVIEENRGRGAEDSPRNSLWSYTKQPSWEAKNQPETAPSCLSDSGIDPYCHKVLLPGNVPIDASDNEPIIQHVKSEQDSNIPRMEPREYGSSSEILSYLGITAISMVVIILGHWFIEKMRCDSAYIKRINDLERSLLYAELESKNLKIDLEENQQKAVSIEESDKVSPANEQLLALIDTCGELQEKSAALEEKNASLQSSLDEATQAGLDLNRMLSELLATNEGSESLIGSVNDLQKQLNDQQATISKMKIVLNAKENEAESLHQSLTTSQTTIKSLDEELKAVTETFNEFLVEKATLESQFKTVKTDLDAKLKLRCENEERLSEEICKLRGNIAGIESELSTRDVEIALLRGCITKLKEDGTCQDEDFKALFNVAKAEAACLKLEKEKNVLSDALQEEKGVRILLEGHYKVITSEVAKLREAVEQSEKEKNEAVTKHAVLADYFKDKETQLHKELGYRDALYMQTKGDATTNHEAVKLLHEQVENYKAQIETLKKEIIDQDRGFKTQILAFEKKSHDNWLAARQAERKLQESKLEAGLLRNRLTIVEKNASNALLSDKAAPIGVSNDREIMEGNIGSQGSPLPYPMEVNANLGGPYDAFSPSSAQNNSPLSPIHALETQYHERSNHTSPAIMARSRLPANPSDITFTVDEARDPNSPFFGILSPHAPQDPFHGRPIQDRINPDVYHILPLFPYGGPPPLILPPPVFPNLNISHDRRPPPLGRMSSPPIGGRMSPPPPPGHLSSPYDRSTPPHRRMSPPDRRHRGHRHSSPRRRDSPAHTSHSLEQERRKSVSPFEPIPQQERGRRNSVTHRSPLDHSIGQERTSSGRSYRHRTPTRRRYSDSSPDSASDSRRYPSRYDYSPENYRNRSRTPSPTGFRPISRETSNNEGSNRSSNHSFESDDSNRPTGRP